MSKFSGMAAVVVKAWNAGNADKNGNTPVLLKCVAGTMPNRAIISGTVAENEGLVENSTYLVSITEGDIDAEYGRQFNFTNLGELGMMDIISAQKELGKSVVFDASASEESVEEEIVEEEIVAEETESL
jgi:hypothetical protein